MIKDNKGQISLEYLLIFAVSLILLIAFTLPLLEFGLENTMDLSNSLNAKSELSKLSNAISQVYGEGQGSRQTIYLTLDKPVDVKITSSYIYPKGLNTTDQPLSFYFIPFLLQAII